MILTAKFQKLSVDQLTGKQHTVIFAVNGTSVSGTLELLFNSDTVQIIDGNEQVELNIIGVIGEAAENIESKFEVEKAAEKAIEEATAAAAQAEADALLSSKQAQQAAAVANVDGPQAGSEPS